MKGSILILAMFISNSYATVTEELFKSIKLRKFHRVAQLGIYEERVNKTNKNGETPLEFALRLHRELQQEKTSNNIEKRKKQDELLKSKEIIGFYLRRPNLIITDDMIDKYHDILMDAAIKYGIQRSQLNQHSAFDADKLDPRKIIDTKRERKPAMQPGIFGLPMKGSISQ